MTASNLPIWYFSVFDVVKYINKVCFNTRNIKWVEDIPLCGMCAIASVHVYKRIDKKYKPRLISGFYSKYSPDNFDKYYNSTPHYWVKIGKWIIDPTFCQFDEDKLFSIEEIDNKSKYFGGNIISTESKCFDSMGFQNPKLWKIEQDKFVLKDKNEARKGICRDNVIYL